MKSHFIGELDYIHLKRRWYKLINPLGYYSSKYNITIFIPSEFVLDFLSIPHIIPFEKFIGGKKIRKQPVPHDLGYRWNYLSRNLWDGIFFEAGLVEHNERKKENFIIDLGRIIRLIVIQIFVKIFGWISYKNYPGCLDVRKINICDKNCKSCKYYYSNWQSCLKIGYHPNIINI